MQPSPTNAPVSPLVGSPDPAPVATLGAVTEDASQAPAGAIPIRMIILPDGRPRFELQKVTARSGTVVFFLENIPNPPYVSDHNMLIGREMAQALARTPIIRPDRKVAFTVSDMTPGTYVYWCSVKDPGNVADHADQGMVGTLTIAP